MAQHLRFTANFEPKNVEVLLQKSPNRIIVAYDGVWNGRMNFNIRELYLDQFNTWAPGKGVMIPLADKAEFLENLKKV